ncbi:MAG: methyltransferase domain-containing protein [Deltaproteobacteria bacterium]|nr:methyltransferase domain-containing protein [Deltaproteobacteria bacterium]
MQLWKIELDCVSAEEDGWQLIELGMNAWEVTNETRLTCYLRATPQELADFLAKAVKAGFSNPHTEPVEDANWVQLCQASWQPLMIGKLTIIPILEEQKSQTPPTGPSEIAILPALGFGTGHHASTRMALELLQSAPIIDHKPQTALDLGAGSGILSLAAAKLYNCAVYAVDNDPLAIENAAINLRINKLGEMVTLKCADVLQVSGCFDLVMANLYAEMLCSLETKLRELTRKDGMLIVSGIMSGLYQEVRNSYAQPNWRLAIEKGSEGWHAAIFIRN